MASDNGGVNNKTRFVYRLKGFNDIWIKTNAGNADITYMGLSPGTYTLCVRMLNDDGTMGEEEAELTVTILSPWYRSWWAWLCYLLLAACLVWKRKAIGRLLIGQKRRFAERKNSQKAPEKAEGQADETVEEAVLMDEE